MRPEKETGYDRYIATVWEQDYGNRTFSKVFSQREGLNEKGPHLLPVQGRQLVDQTS